MEEGHSPVVGLARLVQRGVCSYPEDLERIRRHRGELRAFRSEDVEASGRGEEPFGSGRLDA